MKNLENKIDKTKQSMAYKAKLYLVSYLSFNFF